MTEHAIDLAKLAQDRGSHSVFAPSSSAMWMECSGSLIPNLLVPDKAGREAAEGTVAHGVAEPWLKTGKKPRHLIGTTEWVEEGDWGYLITIDEVMMDYVQSYVDWCWSLPGDHFVEQKVYFSQITPIPNQGGTADHVACEYGRMVITDLKYGKGVEVYAKDNTQAQLYALGFFYEWDWLYDFQEIVIRIAQPRRDHFDEWVINRQQLLSFADYARERAHAAWQVNAPRSPSSKACQWCKVRPTCAAAAKMQIDLVSAAFDDITAEYSAETVEHFKEELAFMVAPTLADPLSLSVSDMATLYRFRSMADSFWKSLSDELYKLAIRGVAIPGFKLVESRSRRAFKDEEKAALKLIECGVAEETVWESKLISPTKAEKELRKAGYKSKELPDILAKLGIYKPVGKPTLAPSHDKRPALVDLSGIAFDDLTETDENDEDL